MKVAMYYSNADIRIEEMPVPVIADDEALMQVEASGICGTDVMEWYRIHRVPLVLGHEVAGILVKLGKRVKNFKIGERVVTTHHVPCGVCEYCRDGHPTVCETLRKTNFYPGGFAQFLRLPPINLKKGTFSIPKNVSFEEATFTEPLGCVVRGQRLAGMKKGKTVLVIGSGISGLMHIKLARFLGAKKIFATDIDSFRLKMAEKFGAIPINAQEHDDVARFVSGQNKNRLADIVILCSGAASAMTQGLRAVERGGVVLIFTAAGKDAPLPVSVNDIFWRSETTLLSSYAAAPNDLDEALTLIKKRKIVVKDLITHRLPLKETQRGFDLVVRPRDSVKVIIEPQQ